MRQEGRRVRVLEPQLKLRRKRRVECLGNPLGHPRGKSCLDLRLTKSDRGDGRECT